MLGNILFLILHRSNNHCLILRNVLKLKIEEKRVNNFFLNTSQDVIILGGKIKIGFVYCSISCEKFQSMI
jgi:hypothetical protein